MDSVAKREHDVKTIYESSDVELVKSLLNKYKVEFVVLGKPEREKYNNIDADKFKSLGQPIFSKNTLTLYKLY